MFLCVVYKISEICIITWAPIVPNFLIEDKYEVPQFNFIALNYQKIMYLVVKNLKLEIRNLEKKTLRADFIFFR